MTTRSNFSDLVKQSRDKELFSNAPIRIWAFDDAPHEFRNLTDASDKDWVVWIQFDYKAPFAFSQDNDSISFFGDLSEAFEVDSGLVIIYGHA